MKYTPAGDHLFELVNTMETITTPDLTFHDIYGNMRKAVQNDPSTVQWEVRGWTYAGPHVPRYVCQPPRRKHGSP